MNDVITELYRLILKKGWKIADQKDVGDIRVIMVSERERTKSIPNGIVSRGGKKIIGSHNYPHKIFYFNTATGYVHAITMKDLDLADIMNANINIKNNPKAMQLITGEILL